MKDLPLSIIYDDYRFRQAPVVLKAGVMNVIFFYWYKNRFREVLDDESLLRLGEVPINHLDRYKARFFELLGIFLPLAKKKFDGYRATEDTFRRHAAIARAACQKNRLERKLKANKDVKVSEADSSKRENFSPAFSAISEHLPSNSEKTFGKQVVDVLQNNKNKAKNGVFLSDSGVIPGGFSRKPVDNINTTN